MLDDANVLRQRDPEHFLARLSDTIGLIESDLTIENDQHDGRPLSAIILVSSGQTSYATDMVAKLLTSQLDIPLVAITSGQLPAYVGDSSLVIFSCHDSGDPEDLTLSYLSARRRGCQIAVSSSNQQFLDQVARDNVCHITLPTTYPARSLTALDMRAILTLLAHFDLPTLQLANILANSRDWLLSESTSWHPSVPLHQNYAKQLAVQIVGKSPVFYADTTVAPLADKFAGVWLEAAKNIAFSGSYPRFTDSEIDGWSSHPIEKPFAIVDLRSDQSPASNELMTAADRALSGRRPKALPIRLIGNSLIEQYLWGSTLADYTSGYTALLNGVNPLATPVSSLLRRRA